MRLAAVAMLLFWLWLLSLAMIIGGEVNAQLEGLRRESADMAEAEAWKLMEQTRIEWTARLPADGAALLPWLLAQERPTVIGLLTILVAASVTGVEGTERERQSTDALAQALALDMRRWWKASAASYFNHVSKATTLADVMTENVVRLGVMDGREDVARTALPAAVPALVGVTALDGGEYTTCAVAGGGVSCWGQGDSGELGDGEAAVLLHLWLEADLAGPSAAPDRAPTTRPLDSARSAQRTPPAARSRSRRAPPRQASSPSRARASPAESTRSRSRPRTAPAAAPTKLFPRPPTLCASCPHMGMYYTLSQIKNLIVTGDIGCYTLGALDPLRGLDTSVAMGCSIGVAAGLVVCHQFSFESCVVDSAVRLATSWTAPSGMCTHLGRLRVSYTTS